MKHKTSKYLLIGILAMVLISCAGQSWRQTAVTGYEVERTIIVDCFVAYNDLKSKGFVTPDAEKMWNTLYPQVKKAHELAGDTLALAIRAEDDVKAQNYFKLFTTQSGEVFKLSKELKSFVEGLRK